MAAPSTSLADDAPKRQINLDTLRVDGLESSSLRTLTLEPTGFGNIEASQAFGRLHRVSAVLR